ncbi:hypothetical protein NL676_023602 [Syzygium grande]|nr:hypothetical protein NL676_023602 [Syzygium grande]
MEMQVEVTSRETIKPSSPMPHHLKTFNLKSLSEALARFYLLSGWLDENNLHIDCNDAGVLYVEARVDCLLLEFVEKTDIRLLDKFLPLHGVSTVPVEEAFL